MSSRKSATLADTELQRALGRKFTSSKLCKTTLTKSFRAFDSRRVNYVSDDDFEEVLLPYKLKTSTITSLAKRFAKSSSIAKIEYTTFVEHAVMLYLKAEDDAEDDDLEEENLDSDDDVSGGEDVRKSKTKRKAEAQAEQRAPQGSCSPINSQQRQARAPGACSACDGCVMAVLTV